MRAFDAVEALHQRVLFIRRPWTSLARVASSTASGRSLSRRCRTSPRIQIFGRRRLSRIRNHILITVDLMLVVHINWLQAHLMLHMRIVRIVRILVMLEVMGISRLMLKMVLELLLRWHWLVHLILHFVVWGCRCLVHVKTLNGELCSTSCFFSNVIRINEDLTVSWIMNLGRRSNRILRKILLSR